MKNRLVKFSAFLSSFSPFPSASFSLSLSVQARWSNWKNLEDDPIRRWYQRGRYDRAEKSYLASAIAGMERGTRVFLPPSFRDVE